MIMKLTPNVTDITEIAKGAEAGGADAVSLINTLTGMKIDINRKTFALANKNRWCFRTDRETDCCPYGLSGCTGSQYPDHRNGAEFPAQRMQLSLFLQEPAQYLWVRQISTIRQ